MGRTRALRNVKEVELKDIPKLTKCGLVTAFKCVESVKMRNAGRLEEMKVLVNAKKEKEEKLEEEKRKRREEEKKRREEELLAKMETCVTEVGVRGGSEE